MNILDRFARWCAAHTPSVRKLVEAAGGAIREAKLIEKASESNALMAEETQLQRYQIRERMNELLMLKQAEVACWNPEGFAKLAESAAPIKTVTQFKERLWELELALEDRGWVREVTLSNMEFSRMGVQQLIRITRIYAIKNPLIKRGAEICALYVFGRGIEIRSEDDTANDVVQDFLDKNQREMGHVGLAQKETAIQTDGSLYFGLPTDQKGNVTVQMIDPLEIMDVAVNPGDPSVPMYFHRQWNEEVFDESTGIKTYMTKNTWYPALEKAIDPPTTRPTTFAQNVPVNWNMPIMRVKIGAPANWRWGIPPLYASIDWARAYKDFLEDWATVQRSLSRYALMIETKGGPGAIAAYQAVHTTTFADNLGTTVERNPPPVVGSAHISGPGNTIQAFKSSGAQDSPEQARRLLLMTASAQGLPETFYGDASTGSLATAQSLDRPTELKFKEMQQRWIYTITTILNYVLLVSKSTPGGRMREARKNDPAPQPVKLIVKFPAVLEHDLKNMVDAIVNSATLGGRQGVAAGIIDRRTIADLCLAEVGVEDRSELLDKIYGATYDPGEDVQDQRSEVAPQNLDQPTPGADPGAPGSGPVPQTPPKPATAKQ